MADHHVSTSITIWLALAGYAITVCLILAGFMTVERHRMVRTLWTISCAFFVAHIVSAFHYSYHWSHEEAIQSTAKQTRDLLGMEFGEGLYFSYGFLLLWIADVIFWWRQPWRYLSRPTTLSLAVHSYLFFIAFNGAVIFKTGITRVGGILAVMAFAAIAAKRWKSRRQHTMQEQPEF
jgi:hypothetical protein